MNVRQGSFLGVVIVNPKTVACVLRSIFSFVCVCVCVCVKGFLKKLHQEHNRRGAFRVLNGDRKSLLLSWLVRKTLWFLTVPYSPRGHTNKHQELRSSSRKSTHAQCAITSFFFFDGKTRACKSNESKGEQNWRKVRFYLSGASNSGWMHIRRLVVENCSEKAGRR